MNLLACLQALFPALVAVLVGTGLGGVYIYRNNVRAFWTMLRSAGVYLLVLRRYKVFVGLALLTTFEQSIRAGRELSEGVIGWQEFGSVVVAEMGAKFLSATGNIADGLGEFVSFLSGEAVCGWTGPFSHVVDGVYAVWTGVAAIYLMLFLYEVYRGRWQKAEVDKHEQLLVVTILVLVTAVVEGPGVLTGLVEHAAALSEVLGGGDVAVNATQNVTG